MYSGFNIQKPFFEIGPKAYAYGAISEKLAEKADKLAQELDIGVIFTPQYFDIPAITAQTKNIKVFAQHMDFLLPGRGMGSVLPEALKNAGAHGAFLNHAERKLTISEIQKSIERADEVGLATVVCADNAAEGTVIARFHPNIIIVEAESNIGSGNGYTNPSEIREITQRIAKIDPNIDVLFGAGIKSEADVADVISMGAVAAGCSSAIMCANDPFAQMERMLCALREAWDKAHPES